MHAFGPLVGKGIKMNTRFLKFVLPVAMLTLLAAFLFTSPVHAQGTTPIDPPPVVAATDVPVPQVPAPDIVPTDPAPTAAPTDASVAATPTPDASPAVPASTDVPPVFSTPLAVDPTVILTADPTTVPAADAAGLTPAINALSDAGLTLVDGNGDPLPLASQQAADAIVNGDPWFKVGTTTYSFLYLGGSCGVDPNCSISATPFQDAVNKVASGFIPSDGLIHADVPFTYEDQAIVIDGSNVNLAKLKGLTGHVSAVTLSPDVFLSTSGGQGSFISVLNKPNGFLISGFNIVGDSSLFTNPTTAIVNFQDSSGAIVLQDLVVRNNVSDGAGSGIRVIHHNGSLTLKNVESSHNNGGGVYLENLVGTAPVTITNSSFSNNAGSTSAIFPVNGIHIKTKGAVTMDGVSSSLNSGSLSNVLIEQSGSVTIKNSEFFLNFNSTGLDIQGISSPITLQSVVLKSDQAGMVLSTTGNIKLTGVTVFNNSEFGAMLNTCPGIPCTTGTGQVSITDSSFDLNKTYSGTNLFGLLVIARGAISLSNVSASNNGSGSGSAFGALLNSQSSPVISPVTITTSEFDTNYAGGLSVDSRGTITLSNIEALSNWGAGVFLDNSSGSAGVTVLGTADHPNFFATNLGLDGYGLKIQTKGNILLNYVNTYGNAQDGIYFSNTTPSNVVINEGSHDSNVKTGINISTVGSITVNGVTSTNNSEGATFINLNASTPKSVTVKDSIFSSNKISFGIEVYSRGFINLTNITVENNLYHGAWLENFSASTPQAVNISGGNFNGNSREGLYINASGAISLSNLSAGHNGSGGAVLENYGVSIPIKITNATFDGNSGIYDSGLYIDSRGLVTLTNISASGNYGSGAYIHNDTGNVYLLTTGSGSNNFNNNAGLNSRNGLVIDTKGAVIINKVNASGNASNGQGVLVGDTMTAGNVTVNGGNFNSNYFGLQIISTGTITVNNISASHNTNISVILQNLADVSGTKSVTVTRSKFNNNTGYGIMVRSYGLITFNNIDASYNRIGAVLDNTSLTPTVKGVNILSSLGLNSFNYNDGNGLNITSMGNVVISGVTANYNLGNIVALNIGGIWVDNSSGAGTVTLSNVNALNNSFNGIFINSNGNISINSTRSLLNGLSGGYFGIKALAYNRNISITGSLVSLNGDSGIFAAVGPLGFFSLSTTSYFGNNVTTPGNNIQVIH
jgi:hypothetical protein